MREGLESLPRAKEVRRINTRIHTSRNNGLFHDSRADVNALADYCNMLSDKINELVDELNELRRGMKP